MLNRLNKTVALLIIVLFSPMPFADETVLEVIPLHHRPAAELEPLIAPLLENGDRVIENGNNLIVKTSVERLPAIQALVKKLDSALASLRISFIHNSRKTAAELNAEAAISASVPLDRINRTQGKMHGFAADTETVNDSRDKQVIRTLEGNPAYIRTGTTYPIHSIQFYGSGYGYPSVTTNTEFIDTFTGFSVIPRLSGDEVILEVFPWSDKMTRQGTLDTQSAHTTIRAKVGEWVEIGSINSDTHEQEQGYLHHRRSTQQHAAYFLIKVEKLP